MSDARMESAYPMSSETPSNSNDRMDGPTLTPIFETPARYRGAKEEEQTDWDTAARQQVDSMPRPSGDICDCIALCRRPCGLRRPPNFRQLARYGEDHKRILPFGVVWLVRDTCGLVCATFTWLLILYAEFVITMVIMQQAPSRTFSWLAGMIFQVFAFHALVSHWKAVTTDPGAVQLGNATRDAAMQLQIASGSNFPIKVIRCPRCFCIKPDRTHHCRICNRCIRKMDHHCPWVNNCVGEGNQKYFVLFTMYICLMSIWAIYMCAHFIVMCIGSDWEGCRIKGIFPKRPQRVHHNLTIALNATGSSLEQSEEGLMDFSPTTTGFLCLGLICEGAMFGLFTLIMCISQFCAICSEETGIESLQSKNTVGGKFRVAKTRTEAIGMVMGGPFSWRWFSPFVNPPPLTPVIPVVDANGRRDDANERMTELRASSSNRLTHSSSSDLAPLRSNDELDSHRRFDMPVNMV